MYMLLNQTLPLCSRDNVITCQHSLLGDRLVLATEEHGSDEVEEEVRTETLFNLEVTLLAFGSDTDKHIILWCDELEAIRNARETHDFALLVAIDVGLVELLVVVEVTVGVAVCTLIERLALLIAEEMVFSPLSFSSAASMNSSMTSTAFSAVMAVVLKRLPLLVARLPARTSASAMVLKPLYS